MVKGNRFHGISFSSQELMHNNRGFHIFYMETTTTLLYMKYLLPTDNAFVETSSKIKKLHDIVHIKMLNSDFAIIEMNYSRSLSLLLYMECMLQGLLWGACLKDAYYGRYA